MGFALTEAQLYELAWLWYRPLGECVVIEPNLAQSLTELSRMSLKLGIISNTFLPGHVLDRQLDNFDLRRFFPVRVYSSDTIYRKPDARIYHRALKALQLPAEAVVMVGDKLTLRCYVPECDREVATFVVTA